MRLTELSIRNMKVPERGQKTYWENGFGVRVSQGGRKSFVVMYGPQRRLKTLGRYPVLSLKDARHEAQIMLMQKSESKCLRVTVVEARRRFLADCEKRLRPSTVWNYEHYLKKLEKTYLDEIGLEDFADTSHAVMSAKVFFNWCIRHQLAEKNPFAYCKVRYGSRDRVLTDDEVRQLWAYEFPPFSDYVKLMLLTGLRKGECAYVAPDEDVFTIDGEHTKNRRTHRLPITPMVAELLPRLEYFNGFSKAKRRIDREVLLPHWTLHDLRRTFATNHAKLGAPIHIVEALLNHVSGVVSGVAAIYIRHNFLAEAKEAQLRYEDYLRNLLGKE